MFDALRTLLHDKPATHDVLDTFSALFSNPPDTARLPARVVVTDPVDDAEQSYFRDLIKPWEEVEDPRGARTYGELFDPEKSTLYRVVPIGVRSEVLSAISREEIEGSLTKQMKPWSDWIATDLMMILTKRIAFGDRPALIEDLFLTYRAGFFAYGWTGGYPDDIRLLAFTGSAAR
jgi:hypothetical protein